MVAVVKDEQVSLEMFDSISCAFHAVFINENNNVAEIGGEHEGFVTGPLRIKEKGLAIGNDARE